MIFYTTEKSLSDTKSKLVELFDLEIRNVKNTEPSSWLKSSINYEWPKITKILYHTIDDVYTFLQDTKAGKDLLKKHEEKKVYKIIFAQTDNYNVDLYEQHIYELLKSLYLSKYNIEIYDTGFLSDDYENINSYPIANPNLINIKGPKISFVLNKTPAKKAFEYLAKLVDLRPALGEGECLVIKLRDPEYFLVVSKREAVLSPLLNLGDDILWAFEEEASKYASKPEIMDRSDVSILNIRAEKNDNVINTRSC